MRLNKYFSHAWVAGEAQYESDEEASFTVVASIGLQGIRLAVPTLGEAFVVTGVGLIGLLTVQLLRAQGCRVLAIDYDDAKLELSEYDLWISWLTFGLYLECISA